MKKVGLIFILFILTFLPCNAKINQDTKSENKTDSLVFIYHIPDDEPQQDNSNTKQEDNPYPGITTDDVTADTSGKNTDEENEDYENGESEELDDYQIGDMYTDVLHGYAEYNEEEEDAITLDNPDEKVKKLHIKKPAKISSEDYTDLKTDSLKFDTYKYSKYTAPEYSISPMSSTNYRQLGGFSAGTVFNQGIDYAELEQSSGVFTKYQYKQVGLSLSYMKTVNTTNNNYNDNFYFAPEWKLNQYFTLREILSADITKNRQKAEFILSINPFGKKDIDRLKFEFGVNQTYYMDNSTTRNQVKFSTNFKL